MQFECIIIRVNNGNSESYQISSSLTSSTSSPSSAGSLAGQFATQTGEAVKWNICGDNHYPDACNNRKDYDFRLKSTISLLTLTASNIAIHTPL